MNREIKFRGKRSSNGEWIYGNLIVDYPTLLDGVLYIGYIIMPFPETQYGYHVTRSSVGQFTCLKDKFRNDVYEGDLLVLPKSAYKNEYYLVEYKDGSFFAINKSNGMDTVHRLYTILHKGSYVVGNIYDNHELVEERK